jgi:site-specific DNA recombinase
MDPDLFKVFVAEFTAEWNQLQATSGTECEARQAELARVRRQIARLVDALAEGAPARSLKERLAELEHQRMTLEGAQAAAAPAPRLHPNLAEVYRQKVAALADLVAREDNAEARDLVRNLIEAVVLVPENGRLRVEIRGELAAILGLAEDARNAKEAGDAGAVAVQMKMVAGPGFEPGTFRL